MPRFQMNRLGLGSSFACEKSLTDELIVKPDAKTVRAAESDFILTSCAWYERTGSAHRKIRLQLRAGALVPTKVHRLIRALDDRSSLHITALKILG
jgi:hypothetical protein